MINQGLTMTESTTIKTATESLKAYLSELLKAYDAVVIAEDKNIYLVGVVGIVQEVTRGLLPMYIARSVTELRDIKAKVDANGLDVFYIFDNKENLTDDEPRGEQVAFRWELKDGNLMVSSDYTLVGEIQHRGLQL